MCIHLTILFYLSFQENSGRTIGRSDKNVDAFGSHWSKIKSEKEKEADRNRSRSRSSDGGDRYRFIYLPLERRRQNLNKTM